MDVIMCNLPSLGQPSPCKSSCLSCSQSGLLNHERYEGLDLWMEGMEGLTKDLEMPIACFVLTSEAIESSKFRLNPTLWESYLLELPYVCQSG